MIRLIIVVEVVVVVIEYLRVCLYLPESFDFDASRGGGNILIRTQTT